MVDLGGAYIKLENREVLGVWWRRGSWSGADPLGLPVWRSLRWDSVTPPFLSSQTYLLPPGLP